MCYGIVYKVTNTINGKSYIGQTTRDFDLYKKEHIRKATSDLRESQRVFYKAIRKYGPENFKWEILQEYSSKKELNEGETYYIRYFRTCTLYEDCHGYNMSEGAETSFAGKSHSEKNKKLFSKKMKQKWQNPIWRAKQLKKSQNRSRRKDAAPMVAISPVGNQTTLSCGLQRFCNQNDLPFTTVRRWVNKGKITFTRKLRSEKTKNAVGWEFKSGAKYYS